MVDVVGVASDLRARARQNVPAFSTKAILAEAFPDALVTGRTLPDGIDEVVSITATGPVILYRRELTIPAQRFAIAHAIAHLIFDRDAGVCRPGYVGDPERESRADHFACELLVPFVVLLPMIEAQPTDTVSVSREVYLDHVDDLASRFHVPAWVIDQRIRELAALY